MEHSDGLSTTAACCVTAKLILERRATPSPRFIGDHGDDARGFCQASRKSVRLDLRPFQLHAHRVFFFLPPPLSCKRLHTAALHAELCRIYFPGARIDLPNVLRSEKSLTLVPQLFTFFRYQVVTAG
uniref:(northern house mosquito) hypothetical protein n=1 Tax=Culex pipiens TaxID=7175 RepID=A0A8D8BIW7_CULPI